MQSFPKSVIYGEIGRIVFDVGNESGEESSNLKVQMNHDYLFGQK